MKTVWIINQYASTPETGIGGRSYYLARELANKGYKVYLIASAAHHLLHKKRTIKDGFLSESKNGITFVWVKMPSYAAAHSKMRVLGWFLFPWRLRMLAKIISDRPDAILCSSPSLFSFLGAQHLSRKYKSRLIFEVRDIWPLTLTEIGGFSPGHPLIRLMRCTEKRAYRDSDIVVSNLKNSVEHMAEYGLERKKFQWIPNGFFREEVENAAPLSEEKAALIPKDKFLVGYTGTFGLANDLYTLMNAAALLKDYSEINFVLVGGGKDKVDLIEYAKVNDIHNVIFVDFIEKRQVQTVLSYFDVVAVGAKKEPMYRFGVSPNKLFDYLVSGKPVLYHIDSGDYHPVRDARCGLEVEPGNPAELAGAILELYQMSPEERDAMGENGRETALRQYEYSKLADKLAGVLFD
jgi:glycosyltransferase involved in cell wall biosynthesis